MPYTPSVQDRSGEILAQGISQGFSSLTQGVERYYKKKEEKEILDSTVTSLMSRAKTSPKLAQFLGVDMSDAKAVQAGIKAAGGGDAMAGSRMLHQSLQQFGEFERKEIEKANNERAFQTGMRAIGNGQDSFSILAELNIPVSATVAGALAHVQASMAQAAKDLADSKRGEPARAPISLEQQAFTNKVKSEEERLGRPLTHDETSKLAREYSLPPKPDAKTPNFEQKQTSNLGNIKKIRELLAAGKDDEAVDIALASSMKGPFGDPADLDYLKKTFGNKEPDGTLKIKPKTPSPDANIPTLTSDQARDAAPGTKFKTTDGRILIR